MNYCNIKSSEIIGSEFLKCCDRSDGQFFMLDGCTVSLYNVNFENMMNLDCSNQSISDMFYCKSKDTLLCSSNDSVLSFGNINTVYKTPKELNLSLLSVTTNNSGNLICAGAELMNSIFDKDEKDAIIVFWDIRNPNEPIGYYKESHSNDITSLSFKDGSDYLFLSGGTDGLLNCYDIREQSECEALIYTLNTEDTVNKCGWLPKNEMLYCFTGSEKQKLWTDGNGDYEVVKNSHSLNTNHKFLTSCVESSSNEILTLSLSENSTELFIDGSETHNQLLMNEFINSASFINHGSSVVAFSNEKIYLCY